MRVRVLKLIRGIGVSIYVLLYGCSVVSFTALGIFFSIAYLTRSLDYYVYQGGKAFLLQSYNIVISGIFFTMAAALSRRGMFWWSGR